MSSLGSLTCFLCRHQPSAGQHVYLLDAEWQRRFPRMTGRIACRDCSLGNWWGRCHDTHGDLPAGHVPAVAQSGHACGAWSHAPISGTPAAISRVDRHFRGPVLPPGHTDQQQTTPDPRLSQNGSGASNASRSPTSN